MRKGAGAWLLGIFLGLYFAGGSGLVASAQEMQPILTPHAAFYSVKADTQVYLLPGTAHSVLGNLKKGQPVISAAKTDTGWMQIYYRGAFGYVPGDALQDYERPAAASLEKLSLPAGYRLNVLGDSITYGDKLSDRNQGYASLLAAGSGAGALHNYGWNGSAVGGPHPDRFVDRYPFMEPAADLVLVFGGTNDYAGSNEQGTPLGAETDLTADSFYGALNLLMCGLKQIYPKSEIVFVTPLKRVGYMRPNKSGYALSQYVDAIKNRADFYGIRVVDLFQDPELDFSSRQKLYLVDGLHPNAVGHSLLSAAIYRRLFL